MSSITVGCRSPGLSSGLDDEYYSGDESQFSESSGSTSGEDEEIVEPSVKGKGKARADPETEPEVDRDFEYVHISCLTLTNLWQPLVG